MKGSSQGPKDKVLHASNYGVSGNEYITCGEKHALVWKLAHDTPKSEAIKLGGDKNKIYLCAQRMGEVGVLATAEGDLMVIKGIEVGTKKNEAHGKNSINALWGNEKGDVLISGGKDGIIKVWGLGKELTCYSFFNINTVDPKNPNPIRALHCNTNNNKIIIGTQR